ncbi:hypothetical protein Mlaev_02675 [Microbacterium laevaniformans]|uniref:Uncharacterized protein n=1 Tax=Microbacterium laevaniformans TaxID=36807 RepID=A0A150H5U5_9MICO|nr:hypothetical protein [Microbacterium laevaniformans]KXZ57489.1 hypothetical protein Mlaev_02675 [Microbacterium laevaniformans]
MTPRWTPLAITYVVLAIAGLVGTFALNVWSVVLMRNYLLDLVQSGPAVGSMRERALAVRRMPPTAGAADGAAASS